MNITVILNGNKTILEAPADLPLVDVLRLQSCYSVKSGCRSGNCGACTVLLNDNPVSSCKIPVGIINNCEIITIEYFKTKPEYQTIMKGFEEADIHLCGYCDSGRIFSAYQIIKQNKQFSRAEIYEQVKHLAPCCTDIDTYVNGILFAKKILDKGYTKTQKIILGRK